jgi:hypothetical protein
MYGEMHSPMGDCRQWNAPWPDTAPEWKIGEAGEAVTTPKWTIREAGKGTLVEGDPVIWDFMMKCFCETIMGTKWGTSCSDGSHAMS